MSFVFDLNSVPDDLRGKFCAQPGVISIDDSAQILNRARVHNERNLGMTSDQIFPYDTGVDLTNGQNTNPQREPPTFPKKFSAYTNSFNVSFDSLRGTPPFEADFMDAVNGVATRLGIAPIDLLMAMAFESSLDPAARNPSTGATGLIQFMPDIATGLGTTTSELSKMTRAQQMAYVEKYLSSKNLQGASFADLYMAILFPAAVGQPGSYVLFGPNAAIPRFRGTAYAENKGLDINKDGNITKDEAATQAAQVAQEKINRLRNGR